MKYGAGERHQSGSLVVRLALGRQLVDGRRCQVPLVLLRQAVAAGGRRRTALQRRSWLLLLPRCLLLAPERRRCVAAVRLPLMVPDHGGIN